MSSQGFTAQRNSYLQSINQQTVSDWHGLRDKYQSDKWRSMSLNERKLSRARKVLPASSGLILVLPAVAVVAIVAYFS
jgi:hypothetical protein